MCLEQYEKVLANKFVSKTAKVLLRETSSLSLFCQYLSAFSWKANKQREILLGIATCLWVKAQTKAEGEVGFLNYGLGSYKIIVYVCNEKKKAVAHECFRVQFIFI